MEGVTTGNCNARGGAGGPGLAIEKRYPPSNSFLFAV